MFNWDDKLNTHSLIFYNEAIPITSKGIIPIVVNQKENSRIHETRADLP